MALEFIRMLILGDYDILDRYFIQHTMHYCRLIHSASYKTLIYEDSTWLFREFLVSQSLDMHLVDGLVQW